jgi:hypothetical protein
LALSIHHLHNHRVKVAANKGMVKDLIQIHTVNTNSDDESMSDDDGDYEMEDEDDIVKDSEPDHMSDADYNKKDPPMIVGTMYRDMHAFKMALASHAVKHEFHYDIEKSDTGRYRVYCSGSTDGCKWRLHASTMKGDDSIKVIC